MTKRQVSLFSLALATLLWPISALSDINCYNPDGSEANDDVPCTSDATTFCCNRADILPYNENAGFPIVAAQYNGSKTVHCCGTASWKNGSVSCGNFKSVSVPTGTAIPGVAGLAVKGAQGSKSSETTDCGYNVSREAAIGAGIGVPLAIMTLAAITWAMRERRARFRALSTVSPAPMAKPPPLKQFVQQVIPHRPVELGASDISELCAGENNYKRVSKHERRYSCAV
ncbi:uncharacterized protein N7515_008799 [Penicillium bovifimosum]|uniref:Hydrophobin n=1 Tax=Penicillium bovifimosum TaxID=126998 RepID=A0A9W9KWQ2_9EURO|nr:uncharacterized protein N7515_008799 [Penicillium bovifimosum]KAJ5124974.1 hypothetical protein N7515_008799 [Penicillium bovifimosum]